MRGLLHFLFEKVPGRRYYKKAAIGLYGGFELIKSNNVNVRRCVLY